MGSLVVLLAMAGNLPCPMRWRHGGFGQTFLKGHFVTAWATEQGEGRGGGREARAWSKAPLRVEVTERHVGGSPGVFSPGPGLNCQPIALMVAWAWGRGPGRDGQET